MDEQQKEELQSSLSVMYLSYNIFHKINKNDCPLKIWDVNHPGVLLFPSNIDALSSFYSIGDTVSIKFINKPSSSLMNAGIQLKVEKVNHIRHCFFSNK